MTRARRPARHPPPTRSRFGLDAWLLGAEAAQVIALRSARLAMGGAAAQVEAQRMVAEKAEAAWDLGLALATGASASGPRSWPAAMITCD